MHQNIRALLTGVILPYWLVPLCMAAYRCDFRGADNLSLSGVEMVRDYAPIPAKPDLRVSWEKPDYYLHDGKPAGYGHFGQLARLPSGRTRSFCCRRSSKS